MLKTIWVLIDDRRGSVNQARGVIKEIDTKKFSIIEKEIAYTKWAKLPNFIRGRTLIGLTPASKKKLIAPFPDIVISISRRTVPVARYIKKLSPETKLVQLMHPGNSGLSEFSLAIVPEHDKNKRHAPNIHYIVGCPHGVTAEYLKTARKKWAEEFSALPKPLTAVIIGGGLKGKLFPEEAINDFTHNIRLLQKKIGGSLLITTSRRTGKYPEKLIMDKLKNFPQYDYLWGNVHENPYAGFLACADNIIVTGDSVSMCCECTATGKPVYIYDNDHVRWLTPKHKRFIQSLIDNKYAAPLQNAHKANFKPHKNPNVAAEVARLIEKL